MIIKFFPEVLTRLKKIRKKNFFLYKKIQKQLELFRNNPHYPSLRKHKLKGNLKDSWSLTIEGNFRMLYYINSKGEAIFYKIGNHDEVYERN